MPRWEELPDFERKYLDSIPLPRFEDSPWTEGPPLNERRHRHRLDRRTATQG